MYLKSRYYLGIIDSQNDCGVCLFNNTQLIGAINEERVARHKLVGGFPIKSLNLLLKIHKLSYNDISKIIVAGFCTPPIFMRQFRNLQQVEYNVRRQKNTKLIKKISDIAQFKLKVQTIGPNSMLGNITKQFLKNIFRKSLPKELKKTNIEFVDHHLGHAASAYYNQDKNKLLVITADGVGDGLSTTVNICDDSEITRIKEIKAKHSYGWFYGLITMTLGFQWHKHEGKVTGLAARGNPDKVKIKFPYVTKEGDVKYVGSHMPSDIKKLIKGYNREDIAAWLQKGLEDNVSSFVKYYVVKTGIKDIGLSGGLFANVKLNQVLHELKEVNSIYIFPHMGDGGLAVGGVQAYLKPKPKQFKTAYLGPEFSDSYILNRLKKSGLKYKKYNNVEKEIATLLSKQKVVARFNGKMEYGPRALGNRSILYQTTDPTVNDWLNHKLKRTEFMPFAPSTLWENRNMYESIEGAEFSSKFMTITFNCTDKMKKQSPGVVHIDGTARPQFVKKEDNISYYKIIKEYYNITGIPSIINTSFNMHEEPIVMTPEDAIRAFKQSKLDYLAIGNYIVKNEA